MIRFPVLDWGDEPPDLRAERDHLLKLIEEEHPGWTDTAKKLGEALPKSNRAYKTEPAENWWTKTKPVFERIQSFKCGYCESQQESTILKLDHYRPKSEVKPWPSAFMIGKYKLQYRPAERTDRLRNGYYCLTYEAWNFVLACEKCNRIKLYYFPVAGKRQTGHVMDPEDYEKEEPLLIFPLGSRDNPEEHIEFLGSTPLPKNNDSRGRLTIDLLQLAHRE